MRWWDMDTSITAPIRHFGDKFHSIRTTSHTLDCSLKAYATGNIVVGQGSRQDSPGLGHSIAIGRSLLAYDTPYSALH